MYATASRRHSAPDRFGYRAPRRPAPWKVALRRLLLGAAALLILLVVTAQAAHGQQTAGYQTVTVQAGDTLWSIAAARYPRDDTRERVDEILRVNGRHSPSVYPGEQLKVPAN